ncbi:transposase [Rhodococcus fascians]|nr:transposase [Rhodococcus fascians]MBY4140712.1 transposase [Rhodococcus fascians]MBY4219490.1 transposase [Rhodococcus fascians]MBY4223435.1 transposase [Rhodococcus fascians]MBY4234701.1 transposase [Rhodococcus fascians]
MTAQLEPVWIGIDIGKTHHHATAIDNIGRQLWSIRVHIDQHSIERLLVKAHTTDGSPERRWAVDPTSPESALLLAVLVAADQTVTYVPGRVVNRMTGAAPVKAKPTPKTPWSSPKRHASVAT